MNRKHWIRKIALWLTLVMVLGGCIAIVIIKLHTQEGDAGAVYSIDELYEQTDTENFYRLDGRIDLSGYDVADAFLRDGYILLRLEALYDEDEADTAEHTIAPDAQRLLLFPVLRPDAAVSLDVGQFDGNWSLLDGGMVLAEGWDRSYTLYDAGLKMVCQENISGSCIGATGHGDLWFISDDSDFVLYREGKQVQTLAAEGMTYGRCLGTRGSKVYFAVYTEDQEEVCVVIDQENWTWEIQQMLMDSYESNDGYISYGSEDKWFIAGLEDPLMVTAFTKLNSNELLSYVDENYLISESYEYDYTINKPTQKYYIYGMHCGGLCEEKNSRELSVRMLTLHAYDQGMILLEAQDDAMITQGLYLWNIDCLEAKAPARSYQVMDFHMDPNRVDEMAQEIYDRYGVKVYYDQEHLNMYSRSYDLVASHDTALIGYTLLMLKDCMAEYPEGFFREVGGNGHSQIVFCLCGNHVQTDESTIAHAAGTVAAFDDTLRMSLDVNYWLGLRRTFLHENTHMMEYRVEEQMPQVSRRSYVDYWYSELTSSECPSMQRYNWELNEENLRGVFSDDPEEAWYIDWYSKCTVSEDEARIMENNIYSASAPYYMSPHIDKKSRFLNAIVREAFPCVKGLQEPAFWEERTGIVDLYQEFPDYVNWENP